MPIYSVCSLNIQAESLAERFSSFLIRDSAGSGKIDLVIDYIAEPYNTSNLEKITELRDMTVWKDAQPDGRFTWVYIANSEVGTIAVDEVYSQIKVYYNDFNGYLKKKDIADIVTPYLQIILECKLIKNGFAILHSACVEAGGYAYAFTGPSGIGKSSRAAKWCECFSAKWISGDRPAIDPSSRYAYGVPWDGKEGVFRNVRCPLAAILKVKRSENTGVNELTEKEKISLLCEQTIIPMWDPSLAVQAMKLIKQMISEIPIYEISCDITDESTYASRELIMNILKKKGVRL